MGLTAKKARSQGGSLWSHTGRKLIFAFSPPMAVGAAGVAMLATVPGDLMLGLGFGGLHIVFGLIVWRRYGG